MYFLILFCSIFASNSLSLTLEKASELAILNNENMKISSLNYEKSIAKYKETRSLAYPKIRANIDWSNYVVAPVIRMDMPQELGGESIEAKIKQPYEMTLGATLTQPVWTFGKVSSAIDLAYHYKNSQIYLKDITRAQIDLQAKILYYSALYAKYLKIIFQESYKNTLKNKDALKRKFNNGRVSRFDNIKMSADVSARIPALSASEKTYKNSLITLNNFIGLNNNSLIELTDDFNKDFPKLDLDTLKTKMQNNEPSLKALKANIETNRTLAKYRKAEFYPDLGAFANYSYTGNSNKAFIGNEYLRNTFTLGLSLTGNIWDSGEIKNKFKQAQFDYEISELEYDLKKKNLNLELETALSDYLSLLETYKANINYEDLSKQTFEVSTSSFIAGKLTQMDLNDVELMYTGSKLNTINTLYNINITLATINKLTNFGE